jgi:hypothetical protein
MKSLYVLLSLLPVALSATGQEITQKYLTNTTWAAGNKDNHFEKADTIRLLKLHHYTSARHDYDEDLPHFWGNTDFVCLTFLNKKVARIFKHEIESWTVSESKARYTWQLENGVMTLFKNDIKYRSFRIVSKRTVSVKSKFSNQVNVGSLEMTLVKN